ncbi:hypothetical protein AAVH_41758, partial [Aphelenchoides avenae]
CGKNEVFVRCSHPDPVCGRPTPLYCPVQCGKPACRCRAGYARNAQKVCVLAKQCRPKPPTKPIMPKCASNEQYQRCSAPEATCANRTPSAKPPGAPRCVCKGGFVRHNGKCIRPTQCPKKKPAARRPPFPDYYDYYPVSDYPMYG